MLPAAQVVLVGSGARLRPDHPLPLLPGDLTSADAPGDVLGDFVLHREHVRHRAIESLGPELMARRDIHQLNGDAKVVVCLPHAAVEQSRDAEVSRDFAHVAASLAEVE
jgi:hypothetical protein